MEKRTSPAYLAFCGTRYTGPEVDHAEKLSVKKKLEAPEFQAIVSTVCAFCDATDAKVALKPEASELTKLFTRAHENKRSAENGLIEDYMRCFVEIDPDHIGKVIDYFGVEGGHVEFANGTRIQTHEIYNGFSHPEESKANLPALKIKVSYGRDKVGEIQFIPRGSMEENRESHKAYEIYRNAKSKNKYWQACRKEALKMEPGQARDAGLEECGAQLKTLKESINEQKTERLRIHNDMIARYGLARWQGYEPDPSIRNAENCAQIDMPVKRNKKPGVQVMPEHPERHMA